MFTLRRISPAAHPDLMALLFADYPAEERETLRANLLAAETRDPPAACWAAFEGDRPVGLCAAEIQAGHVGYITGPALDGGPTAASDQLLAAAHEWCAAGGAMLLQSLLPSADHPAAELLLRAGYEHTSDLLYLVAAKEAFAARIADLEITLARYRPESDAQRLEQLLACTYSGSLDVPQGLDQRSVAETLAGYAGGGSSGTSWWFFLQEAGTDVGCLLLADYPELNQGELVYVGLASEARGRGWGLEAVRRAQEHVRTAGRERLVLAVDERNWPAIRMYAAAGFEAWNRRAVFLRKIDESVRK